MDRKDIDDQFERAQRQVKRVLRKKYEEIVGRIDLLPRDGNEMRMTINEQLRQAVSAAEIMTPGFWEGDVQVDILIASPSYSPDSGVGQVELYLIRNGARWGLSFTVALDDVTERKLAQQRRPRRKSRRS